MDKLEVGFDSNEKGLAEIKLLIKDGKLEDARHFFKKFIKKKELSPTELISYFILKSSLSIYFFQVPDHLKYAEKAYQKRHNLSISLLLVDAYIHKANALMWKFKSRDSFKILEKAENLLKMLTNESLQELMERKASILYTRGFNYYDLNEIDNALECARKALDLRKKLNYKADIAFSYWQLGWICYLNNNILALEFTKRGIESCKIINCLILNYELYVLESLIYFSIGELDQALDSCKLGKAIFDEISEEIKTDFETGRFFHVMGMIYHEKDDLDKAKELFERSLELKKGGVKNMSIGATIDELITLSLEMGDMKSARFYLNELKEVYVQLDNPLGEIGYLLASAKLLKASDLASDQEKAQKIFKECLEDKVSNPEFRVTALLNITDMFFSELRKTNTVKLIDDIKEFVNQIHDIAKSQNSFSLMAENYLLRAKLELLHLDLKAAQLSLDEAQEIAVKYGLNQLNRRILIEQDELITEFEKWERLRRTKAKMADLMNITHLEDQLTRMLRKGFAFN